MTLPLTNKDKFARPSRGQVLRGCMVALFGAFVWACSEVTRTAIRYTEQYPLFTVPFWGLFIVLCASWFVLPIGVCVGVFLPNRVVGKSAGRAAMIGLVVGVLAGSSAAGFTCFFENWGVMIGSATVVDHPAWLRNERERFLQNVASMSLVSGVVVVVWALRLRKQTRQSPQ
jgi:drug/metabolite transporter (DMT)-like permease